MIDVWVTMSTCNLKTGCNKTVALPANSIEIRQLQNEILSKKWESIQYESKSEN